MKQRTPWLICVFVPFIVVDLRLAIYCNAPSYKVLTYDIEELFYDWTKKQLSRWLISDGTIRRQKSIRRYITKWLGAICRSVGNLLFVRWIPVPRGTHIHPTNSPLQIYKCQKLSLFCCILSLISCGRGTFSSSWNILPPLYTSPCLSCLGGLSIQGGCLESLSWGI